MIECITKRKLSSNSSVVWADLVPLKFLVGLLNIPDRARQPTPQSTVLVVLRLPTCLTLLTAVIVAT
jgi:hypothetical protein